MNRIRQLSQFRFTAGWLLLALVTLLPGATVSANSTCETHLPDDIWAADYHSGTQCTVVGAGGIASPEVVAAGVIRAVDVWGFVAHPFKLCFRQRGIIKFVDATTSPRVATTIPYIYDSHNVLTCAAVDRQGTVVLAPGDPPESPAGAQPAARPGPPPVTRSTAPVRVSVPRVAPPAPPAPVDIADARTLTNCEMVIVADMLRFRRTPGGVALYMIPYGTTVEVSRQAGNWFEALYRGRLGWVSGEWVGVDDGECG